MTLALRLAAILAIYLVALIAREQWPGGRESIAWSAGWLTGFVVFGVRAQA